MKCLFLINTPAQVHRYKNAIKEINSSRHSFLVLARDDGCALDLLDACPFDYECYGHREGDRKQLFKNLPIQFTRIAKRSREYSPDIVFGHGAYSAIGGFVTGVPSVAVTDDDNTPIDHTVTRLLGDAFLTPEAFRAELGDRHYRFRGTTELAYLAPGMFEPDEQVLDELGVDDNERYAIIRFNSFGGLDHDKGASGFTHSQKRQLVQELEEHMTVFVSWEGRQEGSELGRPFDIHPTMMHDALSFADLVVSDTQTIITESALLGTPAIRSNSFVGEDNDLGYLVEFAELGLIHNVSEFDRALEIALEIATGEREGLPKDKLQEYIDRSDNPTELIVAIVESYAETGDINTSLKKVLV